MALGDFKNVLPEGVESMTESEEQVSQGVLRYVPGNPVMFAFVPRVNRQLLIDIA